MKIGRNDPCPCGSGRKYKHCCLGRQEGGAVQDELRDVNEEIRSVLEGRDFSTLGEAQAAVARIVREKNARPRDDFHGIAPEQMYRLIYFPFETPGLVSFPERADRKLKAPVLTLFGMIAEAAGEGGLKATAKGNLPQKFCQEAFSRYYREYAEREHLPRIRTEEDFTDLRVTRLVTGHAGLVRKYRGRFILGRECREILGSQGLAGIYSLLFKTFARDYNWAFPDLMPEVPIIQHSFLFTLYLLERYGNTWRLSSFYEDCFLKAYPQVLDEIPGSSFFTPEKYVRMAYTLRALKRFAWFMGLADVEEIGPDRSGGQYRVRKRALLDEFVRFHL